MMPSAAKKGRKPKGIKYGFAALPKGVEQKGPVDSESGLKLTEPISEAARYLPTNRKGAPNGREEKKVPTGVRCGGGHRSAVRVRMRYYEGIYRPNVRREDLPGGQGLLGCQGWQCVQERARRPR